MGDANEITVLGSAVRLLQPAIGGFRTSLDSVMLAAACPARPGERLLDMGCGVGGAGFCVQSRESNVLLTGIEINRQYIDLAKENKILNSAPDAVFIHTDIRTFDVSGPAMRFDHIICNPPYFEAGAHTSSPDVIKAGALGHQDEDIALEDWIDAAFRLLQPNGSFTLIHRADALDRVIRGLGRRFGAVEIIPLWPRAGVAAKRVIVRAVKDRRTPATIHAGLVLHEADGSYTAAANLVLRDGAALF